MPGSRGSSRPNTLPGGAGADRILADGGADLVAFGRPALANPDLATRLERNLALNPPDFATFYTPGKKGYTDYPAWAPAREVLETVG